MNEPSATIVARVPRWVIGTPPSSPAWDRRWRADRAERPGIGGVPGRIRTCDLALRRRLLCPLSYGDDAGSLPGRTRGLPCPLMVEQPFPALTEGRKAGGIQLRLPCDPADAWGDRDRWYVHGTIDGRIYRGSVERGDGAAAMDLGPSWCRDPQVGPGHNVRVVMRLEGPQLDTI